MPKPERKPLQSARRVDRRTASALDRARRRGDARADALITKLARDPRRRAIDQLLGEVRDSATPLPAGLPPALRSFLEEEALPAWADRARLLRAQRFAERNAMAIAAALFCAALPSAFTGAKGVAVLYTTGRLEHDLDTRVNETGRFVFDVLMPGGFEGGTAVRATQKVRLLHAVVRHRAAGGAKTPPDEPPINQEDLLGTLTCFSVVVLDAMTAMGTLVSPTEASDYLHLWVVVGAMLGIEPALLPSTISAARTLGDAVAARRSASSREGRELARVLLAGIERHLPARGLGLVAPGLMRFFLGEEKAAILGLPQGLSMTNVARLFAKGRALVSPGTPGAGIRHAFEGWLGRTLLEVTMAHKLDGRAPSYQQPLARATCPFRSSQTQR